MALLDRLWGPGKMPTAPQDLKWVRNKRGAYNFLLELDTAEAKLNGLGGVFVVWHGGVRPKWVYIGESNDLARAIDAVADMDDVAQYDVNGRLFVTWSPVLPKLRKNVLLFLNQTMKPLVANPQTPTKETKDLKPFPTIFPGAKPGR